MGGGGPGSGGPSEDEGPFLFEEYCGRRLGPLADWRACECRVRCEVVPPSACRRAVQRPRVGGCTGRFARAGRRMIVDTTASRYLAASTVYLIYTLVIMCIDIGGYGGFYGPLYDSVFMTLGYTTKTVNLTESIVANPIVQNDYYLESSASSAAENAYWSHYYDQAALALVPLYTGEATSGRWSPERVNSLFVFAALLHFLNAWQYAYAWYNRRWNDVVLYPEIMNILGSWLYLITATWYPLADELIAAPNFEYTNPLVMRLHYVETAAASWELFAAFGWTYTYWKTFRRAPGRGCTLDDPDLHGSLMIVIPSFIYLAYNITILLDPTSYGTNIIYMVGDAAYLAGAVAYWIGAVRDVGCLWWVPRFGRFPDECPRIPAWCGVESDWAPLSEDEKKVLTEVDDWDAAEDDEAWREIGVEPTTKDQPKTSSTTGAAAPAAPAAAAAPVMPPGMGSTTSAVSSAIAPAAGRRSTGPTASGGGGALASFFGRGTVVAAAQGGGSAINPLHRDSLQAAATSPAPAPAAMRRGASQGGHLISF